MSTHRKLEWSVFVLGVAGLLFAGYLSAIKLFTETCAFNESCPYFLGLPACYFGFVMYAVIALFGGLHVAHKVEGRVANRVVLAVSVLGILFAGYFTLGELPLLLREGIGAYMLGLPTCALGLIFYIAIALISVRLMRDFATPQA